MLRIRLFFFLIIYLVVYAYIYYVIGNFNDTAHFHDKSRKLKLKKISFWECFYFTVITQSTVGYGRIQPASYLTEILVVTQAISTIAFVIHLDILLSYN